MRITCSCVFIYGRVFNHPKLSFSLKLNPCTSWVLWNTPRSSKKGMSLLSSWVMSPWCLSKFSRERRRRPAMGSSGTPATWLDNGLVPKWPAVRVVGFTCFTPHQSCGRLTFPTEHRSSTPQTLPTSHWCWSSNRALSSASRVRTSLSSAVNHQKVFIRLFLEIFNTQGYRTSFELTKQCSQGHGSTQAFNLRARLHDNSYTKK